MYDTIRCLQKLIKNDRLKFMIHYGSSLDDEINFNDIDIFAIYGDFGETEHIMVGKIDLVLMDANVFAKYLYNFDPSCTEPLKTGKLLYGNRNDFINMKQNLLKSKPKLENISYLLRRSFSEHFKTLEYASENNILSAYISMSFSMSYRIFAQWYCRKGGHITLKELLEKGECDLLQNIHSKIHDINDKTIIINKEELMRDIYMWETTLLKSNNWFT